MHCVSGTKRQPPLKNSEISADQLIYYFIPILNYLIYLRMKVQQIKAQLEQRQK